MNPSLTRREAIVALAAIPAIAARAAERNYTISTFTTEVTPPIGHPCMGGGIAPVKQIDDPLFANGFILQGAGKPIVYIAVDWCEIRNDAYDRWRDVIAEAVGTDRVRVLVSALHQHDAPIADLTAQKLLEENKAKGAICMLDFHETTVQRVARAAKASLAKSRTIAQFGIGLAKVEKVASNRRYIDEAGKVRYDRMSASRDAKIRAGEEGTIDPYLKTLSFWDTEDKPILALSVYATHPMSYYGKGAVSADFVGMARKRRQTDLPDVLQIYASGCSGNVTAGKYNDGAAENRPVLAERIHAAMKEAWKQTNKHRLKEIAFHSTPLRLEARTGPGFSEKELMDRLKNDPRPFGQCLAALGLSWRKRVEAGQAIDLPVIDFGAAMFALLPAESYVEYQLLAQKLRPDTFVVVAGYGECGPGYIPIERAWKEHDANLNDWCWVNPGSEKRMTDALKTAFKKPD
jgi:hypothetical protein